MDQSQKNFKLKSLPSIDFIILLEFNDMVGKKNSLSLMLLKVIEALVQVSNSKVLILQHY